MNTKIISNFAAKLIGVFKGVSIQQFKRFFQNEDDCKQYLFDLKWKEGYRCRNCGCTKSHKGRTRFHMRCQSCGYDESVTAHAVLHNLKIPLLKAFGMTFRLAVKKKGMSTMELAREFSVNQKSSWLFKRKAQEAMKSSGKHRLASKIEVDELLIGGPEKGKRGRNKGGKKLVVIAVEKVKDNKIGRAYGEVIEEASGECFKPFFERHIDNDNAQVITDGWRGYWPLESEFETRAKAVQWRKKLPRTICCDHEFERMAERSSSSLFRKVYQRIFGWVLLSV